MEEFPKVDVEKAAAEVKAHIDARKMDLVDYTYVNIETYPSPTDEKMPEMCRFAAMWREFFDYADTVTKDDGTGFPEEIAHRYEEEALKVQEAVNQDHAWWEGVRAKVLPMYRKPELPMSDEDKKKAEEKRAAMEAADAAKHDGVSRIKQQRAELDTLLKAWQEKRWRSILITYDPVGMDVTTTQMWTNPKTGVRYRGDVIRNTEYPQGFIIKVK